MLSTKRLEKESAKSLYEIQAELALEEGNLLEAASLFLAAARFHAAKGNEAVRLLAESDRCNRLHLAETLAESL